jgi:hypothetical protein
MKKYAMTAASFLVTLSIALSNNMVIAADDEGGKEKDPDYIMDTSKIGNSYDGYIRSEQILELGALTPSALSIEGEQSLRQGSIDRALTVLQRSVELAPLDMDSRILYAQTLQKKLAMQKKNQDPKLFNFLVKQWLFVYRKSEFYDQKMIGMNGVFGLTGTRPKRFEKDPKFLARVMKSEESVKIALKDKKSNAVAKDAKNSKDPSAEDTTVKNETRTRSIFDMNDELTKTHQQGY